MMNNIILENTHFRLIVDENCIAKSLIHKASGEECLVQGENISLFSITQARPFNNEVKLIYCNKRTTFQANRIRRDGNRLIVGFEIIPYEAVVEIQETPNYISFTLSDFIVNPDSYPLKLTPPPAVEFRLVQLPVRHRKNFGEWLNVCWDDTVCVNVLATSPHARIDSERREECRILTADAVKGIRFKGCTAALIVSSTDRFMDCVAAVEEDYDLPRGVKSRRSPILNTSIYFTNRISPLNVDEHIYYAKKGGFRLMQIYYHAIFEDSTDGYHLCGNYDYRDSYPEGAESLKAMLKKLKDAGITPGLHFLQTHIGIKSRYVTPVADHRLNLTRRFTLSVPLDLDSTIVYVNEPPIDVVMDPDCRVLKFGGELIHYTEYSTEYPYCFTGCTRGHWDTNITAHEAGTIGGILDVSEYGATSVYLDQHSDLQDEIADKLVAAYDCGFEFVYFDGSEGTDLPYEHHVPNAQYRVYKKLGSAPLFCEGAAKSHFGWHMLSGANAFDIFPTNVFKEKIIEFPVHAAKHMRGSFTRVNFGWWAFYNDTQPDIYEFGTSRAAAWDCPGTMWENIERFRSHPRTDDILEVMRRWEDVRAKHWLSAEQKEMLKNTDQEHTLLLTGSGEYELVPYTQIKTCSDELRAFFFQRNGKNYVTCWNTVGSGKFKLPLSAQKVTYEKDPDGEIIPFDACGDNIIISIAGKSYLSTELSKEELLAAFEKAEIV